MKHAFARAVLASLPLLAAYPAYAQQGPEGPPAAEEPIVVTPAAG